MKQLLMIMLCMLLSQLCLRGQQAAPVKTPTTEKELLEAIQNGQPDQQQVQWLIRLSSLYLVKPKSEKDDIARARQYVTQAEILSHSLKYKTGINDATVQKAKIHIELGELNVAEQMAEASKDTTRAKIYIALAREKRYIDNTPAGLKAGISYARKGIAAIPAHSNVNVHVAALSELHAIYSKLNDTRQMEAVLWEKLNVLRATKPVQYYLTYIDISDHHYDLGALDKAQEYCLEALKGVEATRDINLARQVYYTLAFIYRNTGRFEDCIYYFNATADIARQQNNKNGYIQAKGDAINAMQKMGRNAEALAIAEQMYREMPPENNFQRTYYAGMLGNCYKTTGQYQKAEQQFKQIFEFNNKPDFYSVYYFMMIGQFYVETQQYEKAAPYLKAVEQRRGPDINPLNEGHLEFMLYRVDSAAGNYLSAIGHLMKNKILDDSVRQEAKEKQLRELQVKFDTEKKDQDIRLKAQDILLLNRQSDLQQKDLDQARLQLEFEAKDKAQSLELAQAETEKRDKGLQVQQANIELLKKESQLQQSNLARARNIRNMFIGGAIALVLLMGMGYNRYRIKQRNNERLEAQQKIIFENNTRLQQLLNEKEWLLKEVHHRVKNNLHTVMSLLESQSAYLQDDALLAIRDSQHRVFAMSLIHQKLYQSDDVTTIDMAVYLPELINYLADSFNTRKRINFRLQIDPVELDVSQAIPVGLILNEAITNSINYAFPNGGDSEISIIMKAEATNRISLVIADNGIGLPPAFDTFKPGSLGLKLMKGLTGDISGDFQIDGTSGCRIRISFPADAILGYKRTATTHAPDFAMS